MVGCGTKKCLVPGNLQCPSNRATVTNRYLASVAHHRKLPALISTYSSSRTSLPFLPRASVAPFLPFGLLHLCEIHSLLEFSLLLSVSLCFLSRRYCSSRVEVELEPLRDTPGVASLPLHIKLLRSSLDLVALCAAYLLLCCALAAPWLYKLQNTRIEVVIMSTRYSLRQTPKYDTLPLLPFHAIASLCGD